MILFFIRIFPYDSSLFFIFFIEREPIIIMCRHFKIVQCTYDSVGKRWKKWQDSYISCRPYSATPTNLSLSFIVPLLEDTPVTVNPYMHKHHIKPITIYK